MFIRHSSSPEPVWKVDPTKCIGCGDCTVICPVSVFNILPPPCQIACPINTNVLKYICLIHQGRFAEAFASIRELHPFVGILGRVCTHPCEKECKRGETGEPIAIRVLKRCTAEYGQDYEEWKPARIKSGGRRVAVAGSGPSGLMAAYDLARWGYNVTVFESLPVVGGMLSVGIPEYRLPKTIVQSEVGQVEKIGVEIRVNASVGKDITFDSLVKQGYEALLLAIGAHKSLKLQIPGEDRFEGVLDAISFLRQVNLENTKRISGKVIVVGGGNAAVDAARTLLRLGSDEVNILYRRTEEEMPAIESEVVEAEREGIRIHYLVAPTRVIGKRGKVVGLECLRTHLDESDASGRRKPIPIIGSEFFMEASLIISAIGQKPDLSFLPEDGGIKVSDQGLIVADSTAMTTSKPGVFAAGDGVTGRGTVIDALASGKRAAMAIDCYLRGEKLEQTDIKKVKAQIMAPKRSWWEEMAKVEQQKTLELPVKERLLSFAEVELGLTEQSAVEEARRCLKCAIFASMDQESCCRETCRICERHCWKGAISAY